MKKIKRIHLRVLSMMLVLCMLLTTFSLAVFAEGNTVDDASVNNGDEAVSNDQAPAESGTEAENLVDVVVLINNVAASRKVKKTDVEVKKYREENLPKNIISNPDKVIGKYAKRDLYAGEYVSADQLSDKSTTQSSSGILIQQVAKSNEVFVDVTDYFPSNTGEDVTTHLQKLIDTNPGRTLYFPDGEYIISRPILTNGGAAYTVSLWLSDGAVIKADPVKWRADNKGNTAMFCMGKADRDEPRNNDVVSPGSYYSLQGGTIDGSGKARIGLSLGGGRETLIKNVVIRNVTIGIDIPLGTNNVSSDMDVDDVTIIGQGASGSIGINVVGYDNTFTNTRIYGMERSVVTESGGNAFRDIRIYNTSSLYSSTKGFEEVNGSNNFYYHCYVQDCEIAFKLNGASNTIDSCVGKWTANKGSQTLFKMGSTSQVSMCRAEWFGNGSHSYGTSKYDCGYKIEQTNN